MATYEESGVNISLGDKCSEIAYNKAKETFASRRGMIGAPKIDDGGFTGMLDMGDFYLVQNDDGIGTKMIIADLCEKYDTMGYDLLAMVVDDAICVGAEVISVTNTLDVNQVDAEVSEELMEGLKRAAIQQKVVIPGGEIAELSSMINGNVWNSTAVGVVKKDKVIDGSKIAAGDIVIGLSSQGFRSNGYSLIRHILKEAFGENWHQEKYDESITWGKKMLTPSLIYHDFLLSLHGRFDEEASVKLKGLVHVTGGGLPGNLPRLVKKKGLGMKLDNLPAPHPEMLKLQELGKVTDDEAYKTWNMGVGMCVVVSREEAEKVLNTASEQGFKAQQIGEVVDEPGIQLTSQGFYKNIN